MSALQDYCEEGIYGNMRIFLFKVWDEEKWAENDLYYFTLLTHEKGIKQRNTNIIWKGEPGLYLAWVEPDSHEDFNDTRGIPYTLGVHSKQEEEPTTIELISPDRMAYEDVLKSMFSKVLKSEHQNNGSILVREENDPGLCYLDKTKDMGYLFICYECDPVKQIVVTSGPGVEQIHIDNEEPGTTQYFKVALGDAEFSINIVINDMDGKTKYIRHFKDTGMEQLEVPDYGDEEEEAEAAAEAERLRLVEEAAAAEEEAEAEAEAAEAEAEAEAAEAEAEDEAERIRLEEEAAA